MKILFVHQNFPAQFKFVAPSLAKRGHEIRAMTMNNQAGYDDLALYKYTSTRSSTPNIHPWVGDFETKVLRGEAAFRKALEISAIGYTPDVIVAHPGWGEAMFLKDVWPKAKLGMYCEFYYHSSGADVGFDPEFPVIDSGDVCKLRLKNISSDLHMQIADQGISPTKWQASLFPSEFQKKISVIHDGVDTNKIVPNLSAELTIKSNGKVFTLKKGDEVITFVNRNMEPYRGYHIFMRSLPKILRDRPHARILIVGGDGVSYGAGPGVGRTWKNIFLDEVRNKLSIDELSRIHFLGHIPYSHFIPLLQISAVHVYLTYPFVLSWSLIEAMSAGCSIVASKTQPVEEVIKHGENGLLVDFFDYENLARSVLSLLDNKCDAKLLGERARSYAIQNYDLNSICLPKQIKWVEDLS